VEYYLRGGNANFRAAFYTADRQRRWKTFAVAKYGFETAKRLAIEWRKKWEDGQLSSSNGPQCNSSNQPPTPNSSTAVSDHLNPEHLGGASGAGGGSNNNVEEGGSVLVNVGEGAGSTDNVGVAGGCSHNIVLKTGGDDDGATGDPKLRSSNIGHCESGPERNPTIVPPHRR